MDSLITSAARALAMGDPLGALKRVALRDDAPALALRGTAMAQLGDLVRAKGLLRRAARAFGAREPIARARCVVAEAEVAFAARDLRWDEAGVRAAAKELAARGDHANAAHARYLALRRALLLGRVDDVARALAVDPTSLPPVARTTHELLCAGVAVRRLEAGRASEALARAARAARETGIDALVAEVEHAAHALAAPAARLVAPRRAQALGLADVEALFATRTLVVDACRGLVRCERKQVSLASRPVLFTLARALGEAWPAGVSRDELIARAFGGRRADESHRARLRVEIGRLRALLRDLAALHATKRGFVLHPLRGASLAVLAPPIDEPHAEVLSLLSDGETWSSSALALALDRSQRTVQRALDALAAERKVEPLGRGRARRWVRASVPGFATTLLLPGLVPVD